MAPQWHFGLKSEIVERDTWFKPESDPHYCQTAQPDQALSLTMPQAIHLMKSFSQVTFDEGVVVRRYSFIQPLFIVLSTVVIVRGLCFTCRRLSST
jgi:hypothetical protein